MAFLTDALGLREGRVLAIEPAPTDAGVVVRQVPGGAGSPQARRLSVADNVASDTTGVKLSYTVPAGKTARALGLTWFNNTGTPTVQLEVLRGASVLVLKSDAISVFVTSGTICLEAADVIRWNVTVAGAASSTADATISIEEF